MILIYIVSRTPSPKSMINKKFVYITFQFKFVSALLTQRPGPTSQPKRSQ
jgi:hypothetical protein